MSKRFQLTGRNSARLAAAGIALFALATGALAAPPAAPAAGVLYPIPIDRKVGFMDRAGILRLPAVYDVANPFVGGLAWVEKDGSGGYIDAAGAWVGGSDWQPGHSPRGTVGNLDSGQTANLTTSRASEYLSDGLALVRKDNRAGFIDATGKVVIAPRFPGQVDCVGACDGARPFSEGRALAYDAAEKSWGYIDRSGAWVIRPFYSILSHSTAVLPTAGAFHEGLAAACAAGATRLIGPDGTALPGVAFAYWVDFNAIFFADGLCPVPVGERRLMGYADRSGALALPAAWWQAFPFSEGRGRVMAGLNETAWIDRAGAVVIGPVRTGGDFHEGLAWFTRDNVNFGYLGPDGRELIPPRYRSARDFRDGLALVFRDGAWLYIDHDGTEIRPKI